MTDITVPMRQEMASERTFMKQEVSSMKQEIEGEMTAMK